MTRSHYADDRIPVSSLRLTGPLVRPASLHQRWKSCVGGDLVSGDISRENRVMPVRGLTCASPDGLARMVAYDPGCPDYPPVPGIRPVAW
jgi:hypothetical protein